MEKLLSKKNKQKRRMKNKKRYFVTFLFFENYNFSSKNILLTKICMIRLLYNWVILPYEWHEASKLALGSRLLVVICGYWVRCVVNHHFSSIFFPHWEILKRISKKEGESMSPPWIEIFWVFSFFQKSKVLQLPKKYNKLT